MSTRDITQLSALKQWIDDKGQVDYNGIKKDPWFAEQIQKIETANLKDLDYNDEFAFWLNAYNLTTIKAVLLELERTPQWKGILSLYSFRFVNFFYLRKYKIANKMMSLTHLENKILRKRFQDPRIHFAINCGSNSCPFLPDRLFIGANLDELLDSLTTFFINDPNNVSYDEKSNNLTLNTIFKWYRKDFKAVGGAVEFIKKYQKDLAEKLNQPKIKYFRYDWGLNSQ